MQTEAYNITSAKKIGNRLLLNSGSAASIEFDLIADPITNLEIRSGRPLYWVGRDYGRSSENFQRQYSRLITQSGRSYELNMINVDATSAQTALAAQVGFAKLCDMSIKSISFYDGEVIVSEFLRTTSCSHQKWTAIDTPIQLQPLKTTVTKSDLEQLVLPDYSENTNWQDRFLNSKTNTGTDWQFSAEVVSGSTNKLSQFTVTKPPHWGPRLMAISYFLLPFLMLAFMPTDADYIELTLTLFFISLIVACLLNFLIYRFTRVYDAIWSSTLTINHQTESIELRQKNRSTSIPVQDIDCLVLDYVHRTDISTNTLIPKHHYSPRIYAVDATGKKHVLLSLLWDEPPFYSDSVVRPARTLTLCIAHEILNITDSRLEIKM